MEREKYHLRKPVTNVGKSLVWIKLVAVGPQAGGKTSLIKHFCETKFSDGYQATVGVDYGFKLTRSNDYELRVHLWDLAGAAEYIDVRNELYLHTDGAIVVFDVNSQSTFDAVETWIKEVQKFCNAPGSTAPPVYPEFFLVGNKTDASKDSRQVSATDARKLAAKYKIGYYETSAASGEGVNRMFQELLDKIMTGKSLSLQTKVLEVSGSTVSNSNGNVTVAL